MKLPLWRALLGFAVLGSLLILLLSLCPAYLRNYRLASYVTETATQAGATEDTVRSAILRRAADLQLPVKPADVHVNRQAERFQVDLRYVYEVNLAVARIDLHLNAGSK